MKKFGTVIALTTLLSSSIAFANFSDGMDSSSCGAIAKACKAAGFARKNDDKRFWKDCMEPLLLGKDVKGVKVDANEVKTCRENKISEMQKELKKLQNVQ